MFHGLWEGSGQSWRLLLAIVEEWKATLTTTTCFQISPSQLAADVAQFPESTTRARRKRRRRGGPATPPTSTNKPNELAQRLLVLQVLCSRRRPIITWRPRRALSYEKSLSNSQSLSAARKTSLFLLPIRGQRWLG